VDGIREIHQRFGELLPEALLCVQDPDSGERLQVLPGALHERAVRAGRHLPISPGVVPRLLERFASAYPRGRRAGRAGVADPALDQVPLEPLGQSRRLWKDGLHPSAMDGCCWPLADG